VTAIADCEPTLLESSTARVEERAGGETGFKVFVMNANIITLQL
jgi:hypothetical protein